MIKLKGNGKLLLTGEYVVLDGAKALALPTKFGQTLEVKKSIEKENQIYWKALLNDGKLWFDCSIDFRKLELIETSNQRAGNRLLELVSAINKLNPLFFNQNSKDSYECETFLEFDENWGLGSSSSLVYLLAEWTNVNPHELLKKTFGGSGYDIACASAKNNILYQIKDEKPIAKEICFNPEFKENLIFVYLNKKQNSREGINAYRAKAKNEKLISEISLITDEIIKAKKLSVFEELIAKHEEMIANHLGIIPVKKQLFSDYKDGEIKSLGAWGGDFILATTKNENSKKYFQNKGYSVVLDYSSIILY